MLVWSLQDTVKNCRPGEKELLHNEALQTIDVVAAAAVEEPPRAAPPASPTLGACYLVASSPSGAWTGKPQHLAAYTSGGWRLVAPKDGMTAYVKSSGTWAAYRAGAWEIGAVRGSSVVIANQQVVGPRAAAISDASGGTTVDSQARAAIGQILTVLRLHGLIET